MISSPKPEDFLLLLEVFRAGLRRGLISKIEVVKWADEIVMPEAEPDIFFIDLSLSSDVNQLIEVIGPYTHSENNVITARVILGLIYQKLTDDKNPVDIEKAAELVASLWCMDSLTWYEHSKIHDFEDYGFYYPPDHETLKAELFVFLDTYKDFTLINHEQWQKINDGIEPLLKEKQVADAIAYEAYRKEWERKETRLWIKNASINILYVLVIMGFIFWIMIDSFRHGIAIACFLIFFVLRIVVRIWKKV